MADKVYTNTDVEAAMKPRLGVKIENPNGSAYNPADMSEALAGVPVEPGRPSIAALLREAHGTLDRANQLESETDAANLLTIPDRLAALRSDFDATRIATPRQALRNLTEAGATAGNTAMLASLIPTPASGVLAGGGAIAAAPDALRQMIMPDPDESRLAGAFQGGLLALAPALQKVSKLRAASKAAAAEAGALREARDVARRTWGTRFSSDVASPIEHNAQTAMDPANQHFVDMQQRILDNFMRQKQGLSPRPLSIAMRPLAGEVESAPSQIRQAFDTAWIDQPDSTTIPISSFSEGSQAAARGRAIRGLGEATATETQPLYFTKYGYIDQPRKLPHRMGYLKKATESARERASNALKAYK